MTRRRDANAAELTPEETEARAAASSALTEWRERAAAGAGSDARAQNLWRRLELLTGALSGELAEQLRLILEPTLASRLQGDFRTGKRLNMRKIIPYIASDFRKDKIWLRRSRPSQRRYQVVLAIDDSKSMAENACGHLALESMVLLARAMARLEVGEIGVVGFGGGGGGGGDGEEVAEDAPPPCERSTRSARPSPIRADPRWCRSSRSRRIIPWRIRLWSVCSNRSTRNWARRGRTFEAGTNNSNSCA